MSKANQMNMMKITKTRTAMVAVFAVAAIGMLISSTAIAKPALASSSSVSRSDIHDVGKFLQCIASHGGNDISKSKTQRCVDNYLGGNNNNHDNHDNGHNRDNNNNNNDNHNH
jgi:putative salt-induced outer membrane protein YdiY